MGGAIAREQGLMSVNSLNRTMNTNINMEDKTMKSNVIAECEYVRRWNDGSVDVVFKCYGNGYEEVKNFKTMAAAKSQVTRFLNKCARIYG